MGLLINASEQFQDRELLDIKLALFQPKISFRLELRNYIIQTAITAKDLRSLVNLRRHSFFNEFMGDADNVWPEFDDYDMLADHIILKSKKTDEVIGSYRILNSDFTHKFYSEEQFYLNDLIKRPGHKIELSRACIHKEHRNGVTLNLVWKGLAHYANLTNTNYLFGCASVKSTSPKLARSLHWHLYPYHFDPQFSVQVRDNYKFQAETLNQSLDFLPMDVVKDHIPPLLKVYLKAGAKICSEPSLDKDFRCFDFLTVLNMKNISSSYQEKYFK